MSPFDENIDPALATDIPDHDVKSVHEMGLRSYSNGALLSLARERFDAFVTLDRGILHQHNHSGHQLIIAVLRVPDSSLVSLKRCVSGLQNYLLAALPGDTAEISQAEPG